MKGWRKQWVSGSPGIRSVASSSDRPAQDVGRWCSRLWLTASWANPQPGALAPLPCLSSSPMPGSCERLFDPPWQWDLHSNHSAHSAHPSLELFGNKQGLWDHLPWQLIQEIRKQDSERGSDTSPEVPQPVPPHRRCQHVDK